MSNRSNLINKRLRFKNLRSHFYSDNFISLLFFFSYAYVDPEEDGALAQYYPIKDIIWVKIPQRAKQVWLKMKQDSLVTLYNLLLVPDNLRSLLYFDVYHNKTWSEVTDLTRLPDPEYITIYGKTFLAHIVTKIRNSMKLVIPLHFIS